MNRSSRWEGLRRWVFALPRPWTGVGGTREGWDEIDVVIRWRPEWVGRMPVV